jgi:predicted kinase
MLRTRNREDIVLYACLAAKAPIVVDNTNPTRGQRLRYLSLARAAVYESVALYYFQTTVDDAVARNASRAEHTRVPESAASTLFMTIAAQSGSPGRFTPK